MEMLLRRLALAIGLVCGLLGTQAPEFAQQYRQRLAGAVDELCRVVSAFDAEAKAEGVSPEAAIRRLEDNSDPLAKERGRDMAQDKSRLDRLQAALAAFTGGAPVRRLFAMLATFDAPTAERAWMDFQPAVPTTVEGFVVGGAAWALGWLATHLTLWPARRRAAMRRSAVAQASASAS
jgi:hypothetical protein